MPVWESEYGDNVRLVEAKTICISGSSRTSFFSNGTAERRSA